jgi:hypothetical protein
MDLPFPSASQIDFKAPDHPRPVFGWALKALIRLDGPSHILSFAMMADVRRRQAMFFALSILTESNEATYAEKFRLGHPEHAWSGDDADDLSHALMKLPARVIVEIVAGPLPDGMMGALGKLGHMVMPRPENYLILFKLLNGDFGPERASLVRQAEELSVTTISILPDLDRAACVPGIMTRIHTRKTASAVSSVALMARELSGATDASISASLSEITAKGSLRDWAARWAGKGHFPEGPTMADTAFVKLDTGAAMRDCGLRYGNCLATKVPEVVLGRHYFLEYPSAPAIIELESLSEGRWLLRGIHGPKNAAVEEWACEAIWKKLAACGILLPARYSHARCWNDAAQMAGLWNSGPSWDTVAEIDELLRE